MSVLGVAGPEATELAAGAATAPPPAPGPGVEEHQAPEVSPDLVRSLLAALGQGIASTPLADPDIEDHFCFTDRELDDLTPPLTRIINRRPALREALENGDELAVIAHLGGWAARNHLAKALVLAWARRKDPDAELTAEAAEPARSAPGPAHVMDAGWATGADAIGDAGSAGADR